MSSCSMSSLWFVSFLFSLLVPFCVGLKNIEVWNSLFQNDASAHFSSNEHLSLAYDKYLTRMKLSDYRHVNEKHPFIVQLPNNCGITCHSRLKRLVGRDYHHIISASFAQLYLDEISLSRLKKASGDLILDYVPMLPLLKIEKTTNELMTSCKASSIPTNEQFTILVTFAPLTEANIAEMTTIFKNFPSSVQIHLDEPLQPNREIHIAFTLDCITAPKVVSILSALPSTLWIERRHEFRTHNRWARGLCQSGEDTSKPMFESNITGDGYIIGVADTGIDMTHCQFYDPNHNPPYDVVNMNHRKVIYYNTYADETDDSDGHGTHVSSTTSGRAYIDYGDFGAYNGNAYQSKLAFFDIGKTATMKLETPSDINSNLLQVLYNAGARVFSNSWGSANAGKYTTDSRAVDAFMWNNPDALVLFAAGNDGDDGPSTVGSPATNKNGVCVGASMSTTDSFKAILGPTADAKLYSDKYMAGFSSQGPTTDGRLKPDISAPGWFINAAKAVGGGENGHCEVQHMKGTSMATPTVAGNALLIKQYFQDGWYPSGKSNPTDSFIPSGSLLKAMLIHSGVNMDLVTYDNTNGVYQNSTQGYPSNIQGFGKIRLSNVLNFGPSSTDPISLFVRGAALTSSPYYASLETESEEDIYTFRTSSSSTQSKIRVTLAYTDEYPTVGSVVTLINNLIINVTEGGTMKSYSPYLEEDIGRNNVMMIDIPTPLSDTLYTVRVHAISLNSEQSYALVITGTITPAVWNTTSTSESTSLSESISKSMRSIIAILCLVIVIFGALLGVITYQLRRALRRSEETFDADDEENGDFDDRDDGDGSRTYRSRNTRQTNRPSSRGGRNDPRGIEHRELTEREIQMISSRT